MTVSHGEHGGGEVGYVDYNDGDDCITPLPRLTETVAGAGAGDAHMAHSASLQEQRQQQQQQQQQQQEQEEERRHLENLQHGDEAHAAYGDTMGLSKQQQVCMCVVVVRYVYFLCSLMASISSYIYVLFNVCSSYHSLLLHRMKC